MGRNVRTITIATALVASVGGGVGVSHATGVGPAAARYDVKSATWYTDNAVRAWGAGNSGLASKYLTGGTSRALFGWKHAGGSGWSRTGVSASGHQTYVSYRDAYSGARIQLTVNASARSRTNRVVTYVSWWEGNGGSSKPTTNTYTGPWRVTTAGYGPVTIGSDITTLKAQGRVRNVRTCDDVSAADIANGDGMIMATHGRVDLVVAPSHAVTRSGISKGSSLASLKRTYGSQLHDDGASLSGTGRVYYLTSGGNSLTFAVENGRVAGLIAKQGVGSTQLDGGMC